MFSVGLAKSSNTYNLAETILSARMFLLAASLSSKGLSPCNEMRTSKHAHIRMGVQ